MKHGRTTTGSFAAVLSPRRARAERGCGHALPALAMIATMFVVQPAAAQQIFADWESTCSVGVWTDFCWGAEPMPNNGNMGFTYVAAISDGNANVTMNLNITLDGLVILGNGALNAVFMPNGRLLTIVGGSSTGSSTGFIHIDDRLFMQSTGSNTDLVVAAGPAG